METVGALRLRTYGSAAHQVIVLHGGPAAVGSAAGLARGLSGAFRVLEPWQRGSGSEALTVATHVADLHGLVTRRCAPGRPAIVGESWGAMLALAYAAAHPDAAGALVLVGCGTFDLDARARLRATLAERGAALRPRLDALAEAFPDPAERMIEEWALEKAMYDHAPIEAAHDDEAGEPFDIVAHTETWDDMLRLQQARAYPAAFAAIASPVLMLHGAQIPTLGR
ncbi:MAG TPA: alpha/beta hydrolase [Kofleriaceae bacterium]|nr:alpha/beta hydrolase [Kofleriaceae bacterium]